MGCFKVEILCREVSEKAQQIARLHLNLYSASIIFILDWRLKTTITRLLNGNITSIETSHCMPIEISLLCCKTAVEPNPAKYSQF